MVVVDERQRSLDSVAQESSKVHSSLLDTVAWLGRVQDSIASLDSVSCDRDRLMLQCRDCEVDLCLLLHSNCTVHHVSCLLVIISNSIRLLTYSHVWQV